MRRSGLRKEIGLGVSGIGGGYPDEEIDVRAGMGNIRPAIPKTQLKVEEQRQSLLMPFLVIAGILILLS